MAIEVEAKFRALDTQTPAADLLSQLVPGLIELADIERQEILDLYLDTAERSILRSGYTLRVRTRSDRPDLRRKVTIKALDREAGSGKGAVHSRSEREAELSPKASPLKLADYPKDMRRALADFVGKSNRLEPILRIEQVRSICGVAAAPMSLSGATAAADRDVVDSAAAADAQPTDAAIDASTDDATSPPQEDLVGELSVDEVLVVGADGDPVDSFREVEFERGDEGHHARFETLVADLAARRDLEPADDGKLKRGLELAARHVPGRPAGEFDIRADMTVAEAGRLVWRKQLTAMLLTEAGARRGDDIEFVHDMRVATRRARAAWMHYGSAFDERAMRRLTKGLKRTAAALGEVRDDDVALDALASYAKGAPASDAEALEAVAAQWRDERAEAYVRLLEWLDSKDYAGFIKRMVRHCATTGANAAADRPAELVRHVLPDAVIQSFEVVSAYAAHFDAEEPIEVEVLHAMRIDCKRLRYAIEPLAHLMGAEGKEFVKTLKRLQDVLGDLNDASVAQARLAELGEGDFDRSAVDRYFEKQNEIIERCRLTAESVWRPLISEESLGRLNRSLADW